jgi:hypothetical protein
MFVKPEESLFVPDLCLVLFIHITNYGKLIILVCSINPLYKVSRNVVTTGVEATTEDIEVVTSVEVTKVTHIKEIPIMGTKAIVLQRQ